MHAIIIGAGVGGLAAAVGLSTKLGWTVDIIEKRPNFHEQGSTLGLAPNGRKALRELCGNIKLDRLLEEEGVSMPNGGLMLGWWQLRDGLLSMLKHQIDQSRVRLLMGYSLESIEDSEDSEKVKASFVSRNSTDKTTLILEGDILLGADGVNSVTRTKYLGHPPAEFSGSTVWMGRVMIDLEKASTNKDSPDAILEPLLHKGIVPIGTKKHGCALYSIFNYHDKMPGTLTWSVATKDKVEQNTNMHVSNILKDISDPEEAKLLNALYKLSSERDLTHSMKLNVVRLQKDVIGYGGRGRVTLIGDSCHALRPASGQGASMALEDVVVLCRVFDKHDQVNIMNYKKIEAALKEYELTRVERVHRVWEYEWNLSENAYTGKRDKVDSEQNLETYKSWLYEGI